MSKHRKVGALQQVEETSHSSGSAIEGPTWLVGINWKIFAE